MIPKSGFTWDGNRKMIQCEKAQYEEHCKNQKEAKGLCSASFPYFEQLAAPMARTSQQGKMLKAIRKLGEGNFYEGRRK
ncbi:hypothetical protein ZWY2020_049560 [Hordeum vulgare]|nr:hypothetical protein ZWY2020_049560 [Hordeum vulgare]